MNEQKEHREIQCATQWLPKEPDPEVRARVEDKLSQLVLKNTIQFASSIFQRRVAALTKTDEVGLFIRVIETAGMLELKLTASIKKGIRVKERGSDHRRYRLYEKYIKPQSIVTQSISDLLDVERATFASSLARTFVESLSDVHQAFLCQTITRDQYLEDSLIAPENYTRAVDLMYEFYRKIIENRL